MKKEKKFLVKELLKTILYAIVIENFILYTIMFVEEIPTWIMSEVMMVADDESEILIDEGKKTEEVMEEFTTMQKEKYGEEYPADGIFVKQLLYSFESGPIVQTYVNSLLVGAILGTVIYIVSVQKAKGVQLAIEIFIAFAIIVIIIAGINLGYETIINRVINDSGAADTFYDAYIYNDSIFLPYIAIFAIVYFGNMIQQKILTNKLNKELNNN